MNELLQSAESIVLWGALGLVLMTYVGLPLLLFQTFHFKIPTTVVFFRPEELQLPENVLSYVVPAGRQLKSLGFTPVSHFCLPDLVANVKSISAMWVNESTREGALVNCLFADGAAGSVKNFHVEFITRYADGTCVMTNNSTELSAFVSPANHFTNKFWDITDVVHLHRLHQWLSGALGAGVKQLTLVEKYGGDVEAYIQQEVIRAPAEYQVKRGRFRVVPGGYGMTFLGAFWMGWGEVWPCKAWRKKKIWAESRRWLAKFGAAP